MKVYVMVERVDEGGDDDAVSAVFADRADADRAADEVTRNDDEDEGVTGIVIEFDVLDHAEWARRRRENEREALTW